MSETSQPLGERVAEWLETQGYPLEMRVAREFRTERFRVIQSEYFSDPDTKTSREIDVVASIDAKQDSYLFRVTFVVECKMSREKPWVLFTGTSMGLADPARVAQRVGNTLGRRLLRTVAFDTTAQQIGLFDLRGRPAHGVTQAFTSGTDAAYAAVHSVAKATAALAATRGGSPVPVLLVFFPVVVIEGRLFEYFIDQNDDPAVNEIAQGTLLWRNPVVNEPHTIIDVVTLNELPAYVSRAHAACQVLFEYADDPCRTVIAAAQAPRRVVRPPGKGWVDSWKE